MVQSRPTSSVCSLGQGIQEGKMTGRGHTEKKGVGVEALGFLSASHPGIPGLNYFHSMPISLFVSGMRILYIDVWN